MNNAFSVLPDQAEFVLLSFEGPDGYSQAGGLGVRITHLAETLAAKGFRTHLIFIGDPDLPAQQECYAGNLRLYCWCQWISQFHPAGVYDGEEGKRLDFTATAPPFVVDQIARPAAAEQRSLVVLAEEWHTADALIQLSDQLHAAGLRQKAVLAWNANNTMGFERIPWNRLGYVAALTTISRYMKQVMRYSGQEALIIPNGIPAELVCPVPDDLLERVRDELCRLGDLALMKVGRFDPAKCWWSAMEAAARLKHAGRRPVFLCRGRIEPYGGEVLGHARALGMQVRDVHGSPRTCEEVIEAVSSAGPADVYNLRFPLAQALLRVFYAAVDVVLANSKHEPFGLVGLEAMAAGGVVFTAPTGETYSNDREGAIALDSETPDEIVLQVNSLQAQAERVRTIRATAPRIAARFTWDRVLEILFEKIQLAASFQGVSSYRDPCGVYGGGSALPGRGGGGGRGSGYMP
ncbi:MAG TPA: glycosyltransferase family 4 protein [Anaerolineaceae bacterium]|nr:glycosyltransferase family 4 protein [Anaerolineaceae bacterium]